MAVNDAIFVAALLPTESVTSLIQILGAWKTMLAARTAGVAMDNNAPSKERLQELFGLVILGGLPFEVSRTLSANLSIQLIQYVCGVHRTLLKFSCQKRSTLLNRPARRRAEKLSCELGSWNCFSHCYLV